jgi:DNA-binding transcriptional MocR family regulator
MVRRDALAAALRAQLRDAVFDVPTGGMSLWVRWPPGSDVAGAARRGPAAGVSFDDASRYTRRAAAPAARLGFSSLDERELREAVRRLGIAFRGRSAL